MTPQLMQAIKLLQLSNLDLAAYVEGELERNPCSSAPPKASRASIDGAAEPVAPEFDGDASRPKRRPPRTASTKAWRPAAARSRSGSAPISKTYFPTMPAQPRARTARTLPAAPSEWSSVGSGGREDGDYNLEAFVSAAPTLADHLAEQLSLAIADPVRRMIGQYLIDMVDEAGYLTGDLAVGRREARRAARRGRGGARRSCRASIRRASARAISPNAWRSSSGSATASIRRWRRWSAVSICWPSAISPACGASAASATRTSPR